MELVTRLTGQGGQPLALLMTFRTKASPMHLLWLWLDNARWPEKFSRLEQQGWGRVGGIKWKAGKWR